MNGTDALVGLMELLGSCGLACALCWWIEVRARKKQADWRGEQGMRGIR